MFCINCGAQIPDGAKFCIKCGAKVPVEGAVRAEIPSEPKAPDTVGTEPQISSGANTQAGFSTPEKPPKKKKGLVIAASVSGAAVVALGAAAALNWRSIQNTVARTFSSPEEYYQQVEGNSIEALSSSIAETYGSLVNASGRNKDYDGISGEFTIQVDSRELLAMMEESAGMDMSWFKDLTLSGGMYAGGNALKGEAGIGLNGTDTLSTNIIYDLDSATVFLSIPELSDKYVSMDMGDYIDYYARDNAAAADEFQELLQAMSDLLPDQSKVKLLTAKYMGLMLKCLDDVEKEKNVTLKVGNVKQDCTRLTVTVDADTLEEIVKSVSKELADDKEIREIITDFCEGLESSDALRDFCSGESAELIEDLFDVDISSLPSLLSMLDAEEICDLFQSACLSLNEEAEDLFAYEDFEITISLYVDKKGGIRGREIDFDHGDLVLEFSNPRSGSDVAYKAAVSSEGEELFILSGTGKESGGKFNGEFTLASEPYAAAQRYWYPDVFEGRDSGLLTISAKNFDINEFKQGRLNGSFTVTSPLMNYVLNKEMGWLYPSGPTKDLAVTLDSAMSDDEVKMTLGLKEGKTAMGSMGFALRLTSNSKISVPSKNAVLPLENASSMETYWNSINWDEFVRTLDRAGLPSQVTESVSQMKDLSFSDLSRMLYYFY